MTDILRQLIQRNRAGHPVALPSVCSAHPDVLLASLLLAQELDQPIIIEATSNQVNQDGGYTGMVPADFVDFVSTIAKGIGFDLTKIVFGGDHLGPQVWRAKSAEYAMEKAGKLVELYVTAGFTKIHLDCSEGCADEPSQVDDSLSAERAATLAAICEQVSDAPERLSYMVGTEVPPPGGARESEHQTVKPTQPDAARITLQKHFDAFDNAGISQAKQRIAALVVQPGVEFSADTIDHLDVGAAGALRQAIEPFEHVCFEAHSTDYQIPDAYPALAGMGFAIHKIGPALTFAYRQALYNLDRMHPSQPGNLAALMEQLMLAQPAYWQSHYHGNDARLKLLRHFSYADRIRYYWALPAAQSAVPALMDAIDAADLPAPVWHQYFCPQNDVRSQKLQHMGYGRSKSRVLAEIQIALLPYYFNDKDAVAA